MFDPAQSDPGPRGWPSPPLFSCVVAAEAEGGIGHQGQLPWPRLPADLAHFRFLTTTANRSSAATDGSAAAMNAVIMGHSTWRSLPAKVAPLPGRLNLVLSRNPHTCAPGAEIAPSLAEALTIAAASHAPAIFVIGGAGVFSETFADPRCELVFLTRLTDHYPADRWLPPLQPTFEREASVPVITAQGELTFERWRRRR